MRKKVTLERVAERAGVSPATVSRVLGGTRPVSARLRQEVMHAAYELGYLVEERRNIAILIPAFPVFDGYLGNLLEALNNELYRRNYTPVILSGDDLSFLEEGAFLGVISTNFNRKLEQGWSRRHYLPLVAINSHPAQLENVCSVCSNDGQGIRLALDHLVAYGHRRIGMITFDDGSADDNLNYRSRVVAFREYLKAHSAFMTGFHVNVDDWRMETVSAVSRLMEWGVSAVFAVGENYSGAVRRAFHDLKIRIPEDISMIGFENRALNTLLDPPLTTIEQRLDLMVIEAVNILSGQLAGKCVRSVNVDYRLIKRQSVMKLD